jgi:hypothetical protein
MFNLLAQASRHVTEAEGRMALQREIVAKRERDSHNASGVRSTSNLQKCRAASTTGPAWHEIERMP